ncbi:MAG: hypothetical protein M3220_10150, partial [Chloroflexota bacterium]|nr:hypothetical protein [Chloroflexota bacterium]
ENGGGWGKPLVAALQAQCRDDAARLLTLAEGISAEQGVPMIDEMLRRLAAYRTVLGHDLVAPQQPLPPVHALDFETVRIYPADTRPALPPNLPDPEACDPLTRNVGRAPRS